MINIGSHLSISKGFKNMAETALQMNSNTFQFFTRNPRGGKAKELDKNDVKELEKIMLKNNFAPILAHAPYTMNLCSNKKDTREFSRRILKEDIERLKNIPCKLYNFHPGSHTGIGVNEGILLISEALNEVITEDLEITILLETMSGKGTEIGRSFEELRSIIDKVDLNDKIGVCLDTCHIFCAGYDIVNDLDGVLNEFDKIIGLEKLKAVHLNDSFMPFSSNKDRHAGIGEGLIGLDALVNVITHPKLKKLPFYLETPYDIEGHAKEIKLLKSIVEKFISTKLY